jgi:hypothetical protein
MYSYLIRLGQGDLLTWKILLAKHYLFVSTCHPERSEGSLVFKRNHSWKGTKPLIRFSFFIELSEGDKLALLF